MVLDCKDHLLNLQEESLQEVQDREWMSDYVKGPESREEKKGGGHNEFGIWSSTVWCHYTSDSSSRCFFRKKIEKL
jgi:hypothetical protein